MLSKSHLYHRRRVGLDTGDQMLTKQSHKDECDIYRILNQYQRTGIITHVQTASARYEYLPDHIDYQQSLEILREAQDTFSSLPARVRDYFSNDPGAFLAAFADPTQHAQLREFGFLKPQEATQDAPATPPTSSTT